MTKTLLATACLIYPCIAFAGNTYPVAGIYPGIDAAAAKAAGFTICIESGYKEISCRSAKPPKTIYGVPVTDVAAVFIDPYRKVDRIIAKLDNAIKEKRCRKTGGEWGDVISPDCAIDVTAAITSRIGTPIPRSTGIHGLAWHKCGLDYVKEKGNEVTFATSEKDYAEIRKSECKQVEKQHIDNNSENSKKAEFITRMK